MISMGLSCMSFSWMISVTFTKKNVNMFFFFVFFFRRNFKQIKTLTCQVCGWNHVWHWLWLQVKWWIGILYYPSSHNHGSGKWPPKGDWMKPVILFRPPFSTMIMGERIDTWSPNLWCKVVGKGDFWSFQRWKAGLVDVVEPMWIASHTRAMTWKVSTCGI